MQRLHAEIMPEPAAHVLAEHDPDTPGPHDAVGHNGGDQCAGDVEQREQDKAERQIDRGRRDHEPLVVLKMAEDGAVTAQHPVVPADVLI